MRKAIKRYMIGVALLGLLVAPLGIWASWDNFTPIAIAKNATTGLLMAGLMVAWLAVSLMSHGHRHGR